MTARAVASVSRAALAAACGCSNATMSEAVSKGRVAPNDMRTVNGNPRWSVALATEIVRGLGRPVPPTWTAAASTAGGGT